MESKFVDSITKWDFFFFTSVKLQNKCIATYSKSSCGEWIAKEKTISHKYCNFPSSCLEICSSYFWPTCILLSLKLLALNEMARDQGAGNKTWHREIIPLYYILLCISWGSFPLLIQISYGALSMWQDTDKCIGKIQISMQVCMEIICPSNSSF